MTIKSKEEKKSKARVCPFCLRYKKRGIYGIMLRDIFGSSPIMRVCFECFKNQHFEICKTK